MKMREPVRGIMDDRESALLAVDEPHVPFGRAVRWLYSVPTMKRIFLGSFCTGMGALAFAVYSNIYLDEVFGVNELGRGIIASGVAPFALLSVVIGGRITDRLVRTKSMSHVTLFFGFSVSALGLSLALYSMAPNLAVGRRDPLPGLIADRLLGAGLPHDRGLRLAGQDPDARLQLRGFLRDARHRRHADHRCHRRWAGDPLGAVHFGAHPRRWRTGPRIGRAVRQRRRRPVVPGPGDRGSSAKRAPGARRTLASDRPGRRRRLRRRRRCSSA